MSAGLPIVSFLDGLPAKVIVENKMGMLYSNSNELIDIIMQLRSDKKLLANMSLASSKAFKEKFNSNSVYSGYSSYLERLVEKYRNNEH
jgi:glycosyltransferase involved in cell wall biosynthesis